MSPSVFASFFPNTEDRGKKQKFEKAIDSLILNDPAVTVEVQENNKTISNIFGF